MGVSAYAIDLAWLPRKRRAVLIELSPLLRCTGAACFRWSDARDVDVLEGRLPLQFRLVEQTPPGFEELFTSGWEERWLHRPGSVQPFWAVYQSSAQRAAFQAKRLLSRLPAVHRLFKPLVPSEVTSEDAVPLFVFGTLKHGFHWCSKFLTHGANFEAGATTLERFPLVVGGCGVPYLLLDQRGEGKRVCGELWHVTRSALAGLDEYEGTSKGYYSRQAVQVCIEGDIVQAQVYGLLTSPPALRRLPAKESYTLEEHRRDYNAVAHIALKQSLYLQGVAQYGHRDGVHREASVAEEAPPLP